MLPFFPRLLKGRTRTESTRAMVLGVLGMDRGEVQTCSSRCFQGRRSSDLRNIDLEVLVMLEGVLVRFFQ
jgi:hypothetical protein